MTDNTITSLESDEYDPKPKSDSDDADWNDPIITVGSGNTASASANVFNIDTLEEVTIDTAGIEGINLDVDPAYIAPEFVNFDLIDQIDTITIDTSNHETLDFSKLDLDGCTVNYDMDPDLAYMEPGTVLKTEADTVSFASTSDYVYADTWPHVDTLNILSLIHI